MYVAVPNNDLQRRKNKSAVLLSSSKSRAPFSLGLSFSSTISIANKIPVTPQQLMWNSLLNRYGLQGQNIHPRHVQWFVQMDINSSKLTFHSSINWSALSNHLAIFPEFVKERGPLSVCEMKFTENGIEPPHLHIIQKVEGVWITWVWDVSRPKIITIPSSGFYNQHENSKKPQQFSKQEGHNIISHKRFQCYFEAHINQLFHRKQQHKNFQSSLAQRDP